MGLLFFLFIPWLSKSDRELAIERVRVNQQGIGTKKFKMKQLKEAWTDPITWALAFFTLVDNTSNGGISNFFSQLIVSFRIHARAITFVRDSLVRLARR